MSSVGRCHGCGRSRRGGGCTLRGRTWRGRVAAADELGEAGGGGRTRRIGGGRLPFLSQLRAYAARPRRGDRYTRRGRRRRRTSSVPWRRGGGRSRRTQRGSTRRCRVAAADVLGAAGGGGRTRRGGGGRPRCNGVVAVAVLESAVAVLSAAILGVAASRRQMYSTRPRRTPSVQWRRRGGHSPVGCGRTRRCGCTLRWRTRHRRVATAHVLGVAADVLVAGRICPSHRYLHSYLLPNRFLWTQNQPR